jgi:hypothetical protein
MCARDLTVAGAWFRKLSPIIGYDRVQKLCKDKEGGMTTFDKREEGFEKKFAHDEELQFKAGARRNKLLGLWAAEKLGLSGPQADAYAKEVVVADFEEAGDHDVFRKIRKDLDDKKIALSDAELRGAMDNLMAQAIEQIKKSG